MKTVVGRFHVPQSNYDWRDDRVPEETRIESIAKRHRAMTPAVQRQIRAGTISSKKWDDYLRTYCWRLEVQEHTGTQAQPCPQPLALSDHYIN